MSEPGVSRRGRSRTVRFVVRRFCVLALVVCVLLASGCSSSGVDSTLAAEDATPQVATRPEASPSPASELAPPSPAPQAATTPEAATTPTANPTAVETAAPTPDPTPTSEAIPGPAGPSARSVVLQEANPRVTAVIYPRPDYEGNPWSQWGQGVVLEDGRVFSAIGDHHGRGGNSFVYVFDPRTETITQVADVAGALGHPADSWGFGKIHGQMIAADSGDIYFATYWGSRRGLAFDDAYQGDVLLRLDTTDYSLTSLGQPVSQHGVPSLASDGRYLFGEAMDPLAEGKSGGLFVFDTSTDELVTWLPDERHAQFRNVIVREGDALVAAQDGSLLRYQPGATAMEASTIDLGDQLRASTRPDAHGTVYAVTNKEHALVAISPDGGVRRLGTAADYATSLALRPDDSAFLYVPGARGDAPAFGTPVISVDTETGEQTTVVELDALARQKLGLVLGGSYNVTVDRDRGVAHIGFNAGTSVDEPWGEVVHVSVELPGATSATATATAPNEALTLVEQTEALGLIEPLTGMHGHAVAVADVNGDGWQDLFVGTFADRKPEAYATRGADGPSPDRLMLGGPNGFAIDPTFPGQLARTSGATFADLDNDGDPDLIVSRNVRKGSFGSEILRNDNGRFTSVRVLDDERGGRAVDTLDYDGDGLLDIFLVEDKWVGGSSALFQNRGGFDFVDRTGQAGLPNDVYGLGLGVADLDGNGADDLVVGGSNRIFLGDGVGGFRESVATDLTWQTYGPEDDVDHVAIGDVDADGRPDIVIGHHFNSTIDFDEEVPVRLYRNAGVDDNGNLLLDDVTDLAGLIPLPTKAPKVLLADLNADGWLDVITTASAASGAQPAIFFHAGLVDGQPRFTAPVGLGSDQYWIDAALIDANGDGTDDLFLIEWEPALPSLLFVQPE